MRKGIKTTHLLLLWYSYNLQLAGLNFAFLANHMCPTGTTRMPMQGKCTKIAGLKIVEHRDICSAKMESGSLRSSAQGAPAGDEKRQTKRQLKPSFQPGNLDKGCRVGWRRSYFNWRCCMPFETALTPANHDWRHRGKMNWTTFLLFIPTNKQRFAKWSWKTLSTTRSHWPPTCLIQRCVLAAWQRTILQPAIARERLEKYMQLVLLLVFGKTKPKIYWNNIKRKQWAGICTTN